VRVKLGNVLEWITWGSRRQGDPLNRPAKKVAVEVHRRLVTLEGTKRNYGVVVDAHDFSADVFAANELRTKVRSKDPRASQLEL